MRKRKVALALSLIMLVGLLAACGGGKNNQAEQGTGEGGKAADGDGAPATIRMFINMPEYSTAFNAFVEEYKKVKPNVTIELEIMQADYPTILKSKIASGNIPDVFASTAGGEIKQYSEYSADLTDQPLAAVMSDAVKQNMSYEGRVLGLPVKDNLFAMIYNKKLFADAGIEAFPRTNSEMNEAIAKLEAIGVTPFANAYKEWWVQKHIFQHFLNAATDNPEQLVNGFIEGKVKFADYPELNNYFDFIDLTVEKGMPKPLERDLSAEISDFATGKAAMMTGQGAWTEEGILKISPDMEIGVAGYPVSENPADSMIITGADQALRINKDSAVLQESLDFFNWLYTSDYGKAWFSDIAKVIPPIKDIPFPELQMPQEMKRIMDTEKTGQLSIIFSLDSFHQKFGEIMQGYIGGLNTREKAIAEIEKAWTQLGAAK